MSWSGLGPIAGRRRACFLFLLCQFGKTNGTRVSARRFIRLEVCPGGNLRREEEHSGVKTGNVGYFLFV
jgi:hypothetical protein